jgi:hypothetical protein
MSAWVEIGRSAVRGVAAGRLECATWYCCAMKPPDEMPETEMAFESTA